MNTREKFLLQLRKNSPKKYNFSVISDLEDETENTYDEIVRLQSELESYKDSLSQKYDELYSKVFNDELNRYGDIIDQLLDVGINAPDFVGMIGKKLDESIEELNKLKEALNK
tara:strand:+ start:554 stop:892 length:339 start_codon:yes stop_codon:yes gene_type:complete